MVFRQCCHRLIVSYSVRLYPALSSCKQLAWCPFQNGFANKYISVLKLLCLVEVA
jgi:hypothetical protein